MKPIQFEQFEHLESLISQKEDLEKQILALNDKINLRKMQQECTDMFMLVQSLKKILSDRSYLEIHFYIERSIEVLESRLLSISIEIDAIKSEI